MKIIIYTLAAFIALIGVASACDDSGNDCDGYYGQAQQRQSSYETPPSTTYNGVGPDVHPHGGAAGGLCFGPYCRD